MKKYISDAAYEANKLPKRLRDEIAGGLFIGLWAYAISTGIFWYLLFKA